MAHGVKFAEKADTDKWSSSLLELTDKEKLIAKRNQGDQPPRCDPNLLCKQDIFIGFFFDGTNNNKYITTNNNNQTNVARLYEIFPGKGVAPIYDRQNKITGKATADFDYKYLQGKEDQGKWQNRAYRKIYIPGVGQPFYELGDTSRVGGSSTPGAAMARHGEIRLYWALLQVITTLHTVLMGTSPYFPLEKGSGILRDPASAQDLMGAGVSAGKKFLARRISDLEKELKANPNQFKAPSIGKIRLSIFGFSRGAAKARAFVNLVTQYYGSSIAGIPIQFDFLGIFDTVASVGIASIVPGETGHMAWASDPNMVVPAKVKRCAHLVSAHEIRASFPLDSVCSGNKLPANCKEVVYPGVHSDLGGGYGANEQGKNRSGGNTRISQITLAQMYREAIIAGVPFLPQSLWDKSRKDTFMVDATLIKDFNAYVAATREGNAPDKDNPNMYPTETQPSENIDTIIRRHYGYYLAWRKSVLNTDALWKNAKSAQDKRDLQDANTELKYEIELLNSTNWKTTLKKYRPAYGYAKGVTVVSKHVPIPTLLGKPANDFTIGQYEAAIDNKIKLWNSGVKTAFNRSLPSGSVVTLFQNYVHDSRAWFKLGKADDDTDWFVKGGQKAEYDKEVRKLEEKIKIKEKQADTLGKQAGGSPSTRTPAEHAAIAQRDQVLQQLNALKAQLAALKSTGGDILMSGAYTLEPWEMWGYLRWRTVYKV